MGVPSPKPGSRALGVAESYTGTDGDDARSVLAGALVRADRVVDDFGFETCTVGGRDATDALASLVLSLDRDDVRYVFVSGVAPAWFNVVDVPALADRLDRPVVAVSFEASPGLESALREHFAGDDLTARLATYRSLPPRRPVDVNDGTVYVRAAGLDVDDAAAVVRAYTPTGGRPEPLRVARLAARAARAFREDL